MEFKTYKLSDVVKIIGGGTPKRNNPKYWGGNIDWLSVADFNNDFRFVKNSSEKITELGVKESSTRILKTGQVIISARGTVGCVAQLSKPMAFNQSCYGLQANDSLMNNDFLYYSLKNSIDDFKKKSHGGVFNTITRDTFKYIEISLPSLDRQRKIAKILGDLDDKIHLNHQINQTLEQIAQAIFKSWFVDFDPVKAKMDALAQGADKKTATISAMATISGQSQDELASLKANRPNDYQRLYDIADAFPSEMVDGVPLGWRYKLLKDSCNIIYGKGLPKSKLKPNGYYVFGANGVIGFYDKYMYEKPQVIIGCRGTVGKVSTSYPFSFITNNSLIIEYENSEFSLCYLEQYLKTLNLKEISSGSVQEQITIQGMSALEILSPSSNIIEYYTGCVNAIYDLILSNFYENNQLSDVRDNILPKLLSGEIEL